mmetsp:Transcript_22251/g.32919  ORF Transcript_22251/g.32919 Transcript_22251/m.32919 type:complete len:322 (+) Transcript_22251:96-1061(+)
MILRNSILAAILLTSLLLKQCCSSPEACSHPSTGTDHGDGLAACLHGSLPTPLQEGHIISAPILPTELAQRIIKEMSPPTSWRRYFGRYFYSAKEDRGHGRAFYGKGKFRKYPALMEMTKYLADAFHMDVELYRAGLDIQFVAYRNDVSHDPDCCRMHMDSSVRSRTRGTGGERLLSALVYLTKVEPGEGGTTTFYFNKVEGKGKASSSIYDNDPLVERILDPNEYDQKAKYEKQDAIRFKPDAGQVLLFSNFNCGYDDSGEPWCEIDENMMHKADPTNKVGAVKYILNVWYSPNDPAVLEVWNKSHKQEGGSGGDSRDEL